MLENPQAVANLAGKIEQMDQMLVELGGRTTRTVNSNKADGVYYEQLFIAEALKRGLAVCDTVGDNLPNMSLSWTGLRLPGTDQGTKGVE